jgi:hypothetical protein
VAGPIARKHRRPGAWRTGAARLRGSTDAVDPSSITFGQPGVNLTIALYAAIGQDPNQDPDLLIWTAINPNYILWRDKIRCSRGRTPGQTQANPSMMSLSLKNALGRFLWGLGTMIRFEVQPATGPAYAPVTRFTGQVVTFNPRQDTSGNDRWIQVQASGVLQRYGRGSSPAHSATWSSIRSSARSSLGPGGVESTDPLRGIPGYGQPGFWWPCEDGETATSAATAIEGGADMTASASVRFAGASVPTGITAAPDLTLGYLTGRSIMWESVEAWAVAFYFQVTDTCVPLRFTTNSPAALDWRVTVDPTGAWLVIDGRAPVAIASAATYTDGEWHSCLVTADTTSSPGSLSIGLTIDGTDQAFASFAATAAGVVDIVTANFGQLAACKSVAQIAGGPIAVFVGTDALAGYPSEASMARAYRVAQNANIPLSIAGDGTGFEGIPDARGLFEFSAAMGPQGRQSDLAILREVEESEDGMLYERLSGQLGLLWHDQMENLPVALSLRIGQGGNAQVLPPFDPLIDDQRLFNDITVSATTGSSARDVEQDLPLGVPGVGRYDTTLSMNLGPDAFGSTSGGPAQRASFEVGRFTTNEPRYEQVEFNLAKSPELIETWAYGTGATGYRGDPLGMRAEITNQNPTVALWPADQMIIGYAEEFDQRNWIVTAYMAAYAPYRTFTVESADENLGRVDNPGSALVGAITDDASLTTIQVSSPGALWRVTTPGGLVLSGAAGTYASTPDAAALDIAGDIDIRADATLPDWTPSGAAMALVSKRGVAGQRSYRLEVQTTGVLLLMWSNDGTTILQDASTVAATVTDGQRLAVRATLDVNNGAAGHTTTFYTASAIDGTWTQLGAPVTTAGVTSIFNSTAPVEVGSYNSGLSDILAGIVHAAEIRSGIGGTVVADPSFASQPSGTASFTDAAGLLWTLNGTAAIRPTVEPVSYPLAIDGKPVERVEVVSIVGSSSPQTFTITRHAGLTVPHLDGASVTLWRPGVVALHSRGTFT